MVAPSAQRPSPEPDEKYIAVPDCSGRRFDYGGGAMFSFFRTASRHRRREEIDLLIDIYGQNAFIIAFLKESNMAITKQVQDALDRIHQTQSLVQSVKQASDLQGQQIGTLTQKVTELQAKIDGGGQIGPDDLAALSEITSDIDTVNAQLQSAIPANTQASSGGVGAQSGSASTDPANPNNSTGSAPQGDQSGAADTPKPQPLAGTGAPQ